MRKIDHHPVVHDLAVLYLPEVHVADFHPLPSGGDAHEGSGVRGPLPAKSRHPLALGEAGLVDTHLVGKRRLKGTLPVVLKLLEAVLEAASGVAHPAEALGEERPYTVNFVVVEAVHHRLDDVAGLLGFGAVVVLRQFRLWRTGAFHK